MTADEFREVLSRMGLTHSSFADALGVTTRTVSRWATGVASVPPAMARWLYVLENVPGALLAWLGDAPGEDSVPPLRVTEGFPIQLPGPGSMAWRMATKERNRQPFWNHAVEALRDPWRPDTQKRIATFWHGAVLNEVRIHHPRKVQPPPFDISDVEILAAAAELALLMRSRVKEDSPEFFAPAPEAGANA